MDFYLVDTNAWIFFFDDSPKLSNRIANILEDPNSSCFLSIASIWEAAIKVGLGKLRLAYDLEHDLPRILEENGFQLLPIDLEDAVGVKELPPLHGDPFDRIQIVQARRRGWKILSHDSLLDGYDIQRIT
jgi:PIN domain nuclease of toxin-antitoxin system